MKQNIDIDPWDVKTLTLSLGGEDDKNGFITFQMIDDGMFNIYQGEGDSGKGWFYEDIDIKAAKLLRDFLNYAVKE